MNPVKTIKLFLFKMKRANYGRAWKRAKEAGAAVHRPALAIVLDMLWCSVRYGAAFTDYFMFHFYQLSAKDRAEFITMSKNNKLIAYMNDAAYRHILDRKTEQVKTFEKYLGRKVLVLEKASPDEIVDFIEKHPVFFAKKNYTFSAKGVEQFKLGNYPDAQVACKAVRENGFDLIEEPIVQHPEMARIYPGAVNTLRVVTIRTEKGCDVVYAAFKTGCGSPVDNMNAGGLSAAVDVETGRVYTDGKFKAGDVLKAHPETGVIYQGFQIPMWDKVKDLVTEVSGIVPQIRLVGWDVAITEDGPIIVEGNYLPGYDLLQLPDMTGRMWIIRKYVT